MPGRRFPHIYEINTWTWLNGLSRRFGELVTLADVPDSVLDELAAWGFDAIWLMGVWERSPAGHKIAQTMPGLLGEYAHALPDYTIDEVVGSPYAIHRYQVDPVLGDTDALAAFRARLSTRGLKLILDYVPNHVAVDHPWTVDRLEVLITGTPDGLANHPELYYRAAGGAIVAHGRDPYYDPWSDTAQIDAFSPAAREAAIETLTAIAAQCDGVRCDMAMLMLNRIFPKTWGLRDQMVPQTEFWSDVIGAIRAQTPDFWFIAEAYWDTEAELHMLGFNAAYDKRLYDRLRSTNIAEVRDHLLAAPGYQGRMVRFIENHDEPRAVPTFGAERSRAAAFLTTLLPGFRLIHEGQMDGARIKVPVQLGRRPTEPIDPAMQSFYRLLLHEASQPIYHDGTFMTLALAPVIGADSGRDSIIAFAWALGKEWRIGLVNLSGGQVGARLMIPIPTMRGRWRIFPDMLRDRQLEIDGDDLLTTGLSINFTPYEALLLAVDLNN